MEIRTRNLVMIQRRNPIRVMYLPTGLSCSAEWQLYHGERRVICWDQWRCVLVRSRRHCHVGLEITTPSGQVLRRRLNRSRWSRLQAEFGAAWSREFSHRAALDW